MSIIFAPPSRFTSGVRWNFFASLVKPPEIFAVLTAGMPRIGKLLFGVLSVLRIRMGTVETMPWLFLLVGLVMWSADFKTSFSSCCDLGCLRSEKWFFTSISPYP